MADVHVQNANRFPSDNPHEGITHLGGPGWQWTQKQVIASIEAGTNTFYTRIQGRRAEVGVVQSPTGKYLRTHADGIWNDCLLTLAECLPAPMYSIETIRSTY